MTSISARCARHMDAAHCCDARARIVTISSLLWQMDFDEGEPLVDMDTAATIGAGAAAAVTGGVVADAIVSAAGATMTGELLTDAAAVGAVLAGSLGVYAASQPDEAGEAARFVGGSVANVTQSYAELAALNAEMALLEQQSKVQEAVDETVENVKAAPGRAAAAVRAAPERLLDDVRISARPRRDLGAISARPRRFMTSSKI